MKKYLLIIVILISCSTYSKSQDTTSIKIGSFEFKYPVVNNLISFSEVFKLDTFTKKQIFTKIKKELPKYFLSPNISIENGVSLKTVFKGLDKQIIYEDFDEGIITAYILIKYDGETTETHKSDVVWLTTATFYIKDGKYKIVFDYNKIYFYSAGVAFLAGANASLLCFDLNDLYKSNNYQKEIYLNGGLNPSYSAKRLNTMFTLKNQLVRKIKFDILNGNSNLDDF
jgi:hypothetical protein